MNCELTLQVFRGVDPKLKLSKKERRERVLLSTVLDRTSKPTKKKKWKDKTRQEKRQWKRHERQEVLEC